MVEALNNMRKIVSVSTCEMREVARYLVVQRDRHTWTPEAVPCSQVWCEGVQAQASVKVLKLVRISAEGCNEAEKRRQRKATATKPKRQVLKARRCSVRTVATVQQRICDLLVEA